ncbi:cyclin-like protein [Nemania sp. FL0031]|nr:cyclin-like protein [Nemania sp. FL0031]
MPAAGNFNVAARRTALGDRNVAFRDASDAPRDSNSGVAQNLDTTSNIAAPKAQENRTLSKSKNVLAKTYLQPAQRQFKTVAPSASMGQLRLAVNNSNNNNTRGQHKALNRASTSTFVYRDPQGDESKPAPAKSARVAPEDRLSVVQSTRVQPSAANSSAGQEPLVDLTLSEPDNIQAEHRKTQGEQHASRDPTHEEVPYQESTYSSSSTQPSLLILPNDVPPPKSPCTDDDIIGPLLYLGAGKDLSQEQIEFLTNAPAQFIEAPQAHQPTLDSLSGPLVPKRTDSTQTSGAQPKVDFTNHNSHPYPLSLANDQAYLPYISDCDNEEDHCYDNRGFTTAHSYPSRGDNTTRGVTTVMFPPKITKKGQAEIDAARQTVESKRTTEDIQEDAWDVSMVAEYGDEIFHYMKEQEMNLLPNPHYMDNQGEIQWSMRSVLMDWVVQVHTRFGLLPETLFLTVNYIDRFLSHKIVSLAKLQLVGATAIFIAAKYEEINCPSVQEIVYMVDGGYTVEEILKAERFMLSMLDFELGWPGPMSFLRRISKADDYDLETRTLAKYFLEVVIMDERFVASPPSYIAAGSHCLSRLILRKGEWTPSHVHYSGYTYHQLKPLVTVLLDCCRHARKHHGAVFEKYSDKRYRQASTYVEEQIMRGYTLPFQQRVTMPFSVEFFADETTRASFAGPHSSKMPIPTRG